MSKTAMREIYRKLDTQRGLARTHGDGTVMLTAPLKNGGCLEPLDNAEVDTLLTLLHTAFSPTTAPTADDAERAETFQKRVQPWLLACFGDEIAGDKIEHNRRFIEEALELVQSCGCTADEAHQLVDYVYGRASGEQFQEAGCVMVTLAALCLANDLDMHEAAENELARIWMKVETIRAKQAAKPKHSPLPVASIRASQAAEVAALKGELLAVREVAQAYMAEMASCHPLTYIQTHLMDAVTTTLASTTSRAAAIEQEIRAQARAAMLHEMDTIVAENWPRPVNPIEEMRRRDPTLPRAANATGETNGAG